MYGSIVKFKKCGSPRKWTAIKHTHTHTLICVHVYTHHKATCTLLFVIVAMQSYLYFIYIHIYVVVAGRCCHCFAVQMFNWPFIYLFIFSSARFCLPPLFFRSFCMVLFFSFFSVVCLHFHLCFLSFSDPFVFIQFFFVYISFIFICNVMRCDGDIDSQLQTIAKGLHQKLIKYRWQSIYHIFS